MQTFIEDNMRPETVNELVLLQRIRELKAGFYRAGKYPDFAPVDTKPFSVDPFSASINIPLAVGADVVDDAKQYRYIIKAEVLPRPGEVGFGYRTFIDKGTLATMSRYDIMRYLDENRKATDHAFAKFLMEGK